ncbi:hypothetical protein RIR_jg28849.t1 [Rhizophagus irregularis DAOM 181602=DAOM 197198]|nr:hypothetical protein RIR_jg28849.t1 [Rhizophagus irregularis DAOM 181602=DAOM 197198]
MFYVSEQQLSNGFTPSVTRTIFTIYAPLPVIKRVLESFQNLYDENVPTLQCLCENVPSTNRVIAFPLFQQWNWAPPKKICSPLYIAVTRDKSPDPIVVKRIPIVYFAPLVVLQDWANSRYPYVLEYG